MADRTIYFVDGTNGRVFRTTTIEGTPVYEDLGVVDAGGLDWIALDQFDKENKAMVCGPNGVWSTTNLAAGAPTWTLEIATPGGWTGFSMVRSSSVQDGVWMAVGWRMGNELGAWWTTTDGAVWSSDQNIGGVWSTDELHPYLELSSHDVNKAWISWGRTGDGGHRQTYTDDMWATSTASVPAVYCLQKATFTAYDYFPSHHRYTDNDNDLIAIWGGVGATLGDEEVRIRYATAGFADAATVCTTICSHASERWLTMREVGCFRGAVNRWWALLWCGEDVFQRFYVSNDGIEWTLQHTFTIAAPGDVFHAADWPDNENEFVATHDGVVFPLWLSMDRGDTWAARVGNWGALGRTGDIRCVAVGVSTRYNFTPVGAGLPDQAMDVDGNGDILYLGLYNGSANPVLLTVPLPLVGATSDATSRYTPRAGDAINVKTHYEVGDFSIIAGHFGNNEQARRSEDGGPTYSNIDPDTWAANKAQPIAIDPNDEEHVLLALDTLDDLVEKDSDDDWTTLDAALPFDVGAMAIYDLYPDEIVIARINAGAVMVLYSPNNASTWQDITGALPITDGIASLELV